MKDEAPKNEIRVNNWMEKIVLAGAIDFINHVLDENDIVLKVEEPVPQYQSTYILPVDLLDISDKNIILSTFKSRHDKLQFKFNIDKWVGIKVAERAGVQKVSHPIFFLNLMRHGLSLWIITDITYEQFELIVSEFPEHPCVKEYLLYKLL